MQCQQITEDWQGINGGLKKYWKLGKVMKWKRSAEQSENGTSFLQSKGNEIQWRQNGNTDLHMLLRTSCHSQSNFSKIANTCYYKMERPLCQ